jgi:hypothetical protein
MLILANKIKIEINEGSVSRKAQYYEFFFLKTELFH